MIGTEIGRALAMAAYEQGWRDACDDSLKQSRDASYPIGGGKSSDVSEVLARLDPHDLLGLTAP